MAHSGADTPKAGDLDGLSLILVAPNVSEEMGGEAIKALQVYLELERRGARVHQVTHERVKAELSRKFPEMSVSYVKDTWLQKAVFQAALINRLFSIISSPLISITFQWRAAQRVKKLLKARPGSVVHFTSPISPVVPHFAVRAAVVVIGPLNGNIYYPPAFRSREPASYRLRRWLHPYVQRSQRFVFAGKRQADALLVAGGERTYRSLRMAGCQGNQFVASADSGVSDQFCDTPRIVHSGTNYRFVHMGRLVDFKGTDLLLKSLKRTRQTVECDIIGQGPELEGLKRLSENLALQGRVRFFGWIAERGRIAETLGQYRALVLPSLAEANGIVVQEAMVLGLPVIALNWGGPSLLVTPETGILIEPLGEEYVIDKLAQAMDRLAEDGSLAERMSIAGRRHAVDSGFLWSAVIRQWSVVYRRLLEAQRARTAEPRAAADGLLRDEPGL